MKASPRWLKIVLSLVAIFIIFALTFFAALPTWVSSSSGKTTVIHWINSRIPGKLSCKNLHLSWLGSQRIEGFSLEDQTGKTIIQWDLFETKTSLLYLLLGGRTLNKTLLEHPYLLLENEENGNSNLFNALNKKKDSLPRENRRSFLPRFRNSLRVNDGTLIAQSPSIAPIVIENIQIEKEPASNLFCLSAITKQGTNEGHITLQALLSEQIHIDAELKNFPLSFFDQIEKSSLVTDALGKNLNVKISLEETANKLFLLNAQINTENLTALILGEVLENKLILSSQSNAIFSLTPSFFEHLIAPSQKKIWALANVPKINLHIEKGTIPLDHFDPKNIFIQTDVAVDRVEVSHPTLGCYSINQFKASVVAAENLDIVYNGNIRGKEETQFKGSLSIDPKRNILFKYEFEGLPLSLLELAYPEISHTAQTLFGPTFSIIGETTYVNKKIENTFHLQSFDLTLDGKIQGALPSLSIQLSGSKKFKGKSATFLGPAVDFAFNGDASIKNESLGISAFSGTLTNDFFHVDLKGKAEERKGGLSYEAMSVTALGEIKKIPLESDFPQINLKQGWFRVDADGSKNLITGNMEVKTEVHTPKGDFEKHTWTASAKIENLIVENQLKFDQAELTFQSNLTAFPLHLLQPLMPGEIDITTFLGEFTNVEMKGSYFPQCDPSGALEVKAEGEGFSTSFSVAFDHTLLIEQNRPALFYWNLTPQRYDLIMRSINSQHQPLLKLTHPSFISVKIMQCTCMQSIPKDLGSFLCQLGFIGEIEVGELHFMGVQSHQEITFNKISGSVQGGNFSKAIHVSLEGSIQAQNIPISEKSRFSFEGDLLNFWDPEQQFNKERLSVKGDANFEFLPVGQLVDLIPISAQMRSVTQAILGDLVNARIYGELSHLAGPITIDVKASNFKAIFPIFLKDGFLYLRDNVNAELTLTPEVNEYLLKDINPFLLSGALSDHPIQVRIDAEGFMVPIHPFSFQNVQINNAVFDIGKIYIVNGGQVQTLMNFLKAKDDPHQQVIEAWFTPIYINLQNGILTHKRFDVLLAGTIHIAFWGKINLVNNGVDITLGIAPSTLQRRLNIRGLTKQDMFQVQIRGTTDKVTLDWSAAYGRIAALVARSAAGGLGAIVGGIVSQLITVFGETPPPEPTTPILPWESQYSSEIIY